MDDSEPEEQPTPAKKKKAYALPISEICEQLKEITGGWPCRVKSPGAKAPLLFVDEGGEDRLRWFTSSESFSAWLQEVGALKFMPKQDAALTKYVRMGDLYHSFGGNSRVNEFHAVEGRPHEPLMQGHYYTWRPPERIVHRKDAKAQRTELNMEQQQQGQGQYLAGLLKFFSNAKGPKDLALIAAAFLAPGWGGPYGKRPAFVITAPDRGCGKSTLAWTIGKIWGGWMSIDLGQRGEEQIKERLLSPDALLRRVALLDNVKGTLSNAMIEAMITDEWINGKRMYTGDARRPNTLCWIITANGVRLSRDMAQRSFFIELQKPPNSADWDKRLSEYIAVNADFIVADCIAILRSCKPDKSLGVADRWALWCESVLHAACEHPALKDVIGCSVAEVIKANVAMRDDCDEDKEEAEMFTRGFFERIMGTGPGGENGYSGAKLITISNEPTGLYQSVEKGVELFDRGGIIVRTENPKEDFFIPSEEMGRHWNAIMGKKLNAKQIKHILREHREAGRIVGISDPEHTRRGNGYLVEKKVLQQHVDAYRDVERRRAAVVVDAVAGGGG